MELKNYFAQDDQGNKLPGATCYLYQRGTESQATGLQKANGVSLLNPFTADYDGLVQFAAPNGLYDLRIVSGDRDNRIHVQFNDVNEDLAAANVAADRAEVARDVAQTSSGIFNSVAEGLAGTINGRYFSVLSSINNELLILYKNDNGLEKELKRYPSAQAVSAIGDLIQSYTTENVDPEYFGFFDDENAQVASLRENGLYALKFDISSEDGSTSIGDDEGGVIFYADDEKLILGELEMRHTDLPGIFVVDEDGQVLNDISDPSLVKESSASNVFGSGLLFSPVVVTSGADEVEVYVQGILPDRLYDNAVKATLASTTTEAMQYGSTLSINANRYGPKAWLNLRAVQDPDNRRHMLLNLKNVPIQSPLVPISILLLSDSIGNYQGALFLKQRLEALGFIPNFIGTVNGSGDGGAQNTAGPLGEARPGWTTSDYTFSSGTRAIPVPAGGEAAYLAMTKAAKLERNPFLRAATVADPAVVVRNGYVFDPAFYIQRFGLSVPDVVVHSLGTNDARDETEEGIYDVIYNNDTIIHSQILSAWATAKILRTIPTTAYDTVRNAVWTSHYTKIIAAMRASITDLNSQQVTMAPLWAMTNPDGGYPEPAGEMGGDGFLSGGWGDSLHFSGAARQAFYKAMAPYIAAQKLNII